MHNWSSDPAALKSKDPRSYEIWQLEQSINFGLGNPPVKLSRSKLKKYWSVLRIDPARKKYLQSILWPKGKPSLPQPK